MWNKALYVNSVSIIYLIFLACIAPTICGCNMINQPDDAIRISGVTDDNFESKITDYEGHTIIIDGQVFMAKGEYYMSCRSLSDRDVRLSLAPPCLYTLVGQHATLRGNLRVVRSRASLQGVYDVQSAGGGVGLVLESPVVVPGP